MGLLEDSFDGVGGRGRYSLSNREFQGTPPALSRVKTRVAAAYYSLKNIFSWPARAAVGLGG
jgi:hypothetical protein